MKTDSNPDAIDAADNETAVHLIDVQRLLALFSEGIGGVARTLEAIADNDRDATSRTDRRRPITNDGHTIQLPASLSVYPQPKLNLGAYRIAILHQIGYDEFGTFQFRLGVASNRIDGLRERIAAAGQRPREPKLWPGQPDPPAALEIEQFFDLYPAPARLRHVFGLLEGWRIDKHIQRHYPGATADLNRAMTNALARLDDDARNTSVGNTPVRQCIEALTQLTLGRDASRLTGYPDTESVKTVIDLANQLSDIADTTNTANTADVYDSADLSVRISDVLARYLGDTDRPGASDGSDTSADPPIADEAIGDPDATDGQPIDYRGDPFSMPAISKRRQAAQDLANPENTDYLDSDPSETEADDDADADNPPPRSTPALPKPTRRDGEQHILVDEWDYLENRYRKGWCTVVEYRLSGNPGVFHRDLMTRHRDSFARTKRQFTAIRPEAIRRERRQPDGEEFELDRLIERLADRRAGYVNDDRVYQQRRPAQRDVSAAFLLDMSASTDFPVIDQDAERSNRPEPVSVGPADDIGWAPATTKPMPTPKPKRRVIDVCRESLALMSSALESLGDRHAIYGFSGQGRQYVSFGVAKKFDEACSARTWGALAAIGPQGSTRMGAAVRHTTTQLARERSKLKFLLIISDGYPQDLDYGPDRGNDEYGLQDTAMALLEAQRLGIETFCLTVDPAGNDYLRRMCPDQRYLVIDEVNDLPVELVKVYRALTTRGRR